MPSFPKINFSLFSFGSESRKRGIPTDISLKSLEEIRKLPLEEKQAALAKAISEARHYEMSREEREAQIVSFVWGNAPEGNQGTIETVRENLKLTPAV